MELLGLRLCPVLPLRHRTCHPPLSCLHPSACPRPSPLTGTAATSPALLPDLSGGSSCDLVSCGFPLWTPCVTITVVANRLGAYLRPRAAGTGSLSPLRAVRSLRESHGCPETIQPAELLFLLLPGRILSGQPARFPRYEWREDAETTGSSGHSNSKLGLSVLPTSDPELLRVQRRGFGPGPSPWF